MHSSYLLSAGENTIKRFDWGRSPARVLKTLLLWLLLSGLSLSSGTLFGASAVHSEKKETARQIMEKSYWANKLDGSESVTELRIYNARGDVRKRTIASISALNQEKKVEKRLLRFIAPADVKGTGLLIYDYENAADDMWLFLPALRKTRRVITGEKARRFMGSEFSYADMTPPSVNSFMHTMIGEENVDSTPCWVIQSSPKSDEVAEENGYSKKISYIGKKDFTVRKAIYYNLKGAEWKVLRVYEVREIDAVKHRYRAMKLVMKNMINQRHSELEVKKLRVRPKVEQNYFTLRYLERQ